jgi:DNA-binding GntR family transcriptional regulator
MKRYGVSRGTVREALRRLEAEGIVEVHKHRGAAIRLLTREEIVQTLQLIEVLAGLAARSLAERIRAGASASDFQASFDALMEQKDGHDAPAAIRARDTFFTTMIDQSANAELKRIFPTAQLRMIRLQVTGPAVDTSRFDDYRTIGSAILAGDGRKAEEAARRHLRAGIPAYVEAPLHA